jgi:O-antigen/teichoic acid export membrane protein
MSGTPSDPRDLVFSVKDQSIDLDRRTGKSAFGVLVYSALKFGLALGTTAILARLIPPANHGLVALALPAVLIATDLSDFGLAHAITQMREVTHALASSLFWVNVILGALLTTVVFLLGVPAAVFYGTSDVTWVFWALSPYVFLTVLTTQYVAMLRRRMQIILIERIFFAATLASTATVLILAWCGFGISALIAQLLVQQGLTFILLVIVTKWRPSGPHVLRTTPLREALSFGGYLAAERLLNNLTRNLQISLAGRIYGQTAAGLYYRAEGIALMPERRIVTPLAAAFLPALSRLQDDAEGTRRMVRRQSSRTNILLVPIGAVLVCCPDFVVSFLLGPAWVEAEPIMALLGVMTSTAFINNMLVWSIVASGNAKLLFRSRVLIAVLSAAAILAASPFGFVPMTAAYVLANSTLPLLIMGFCVGRFTHIGLPTVISCLLEFALTFVSLICIGFAMRWILSASTWVEAFLTIAVMGGAVLVRVIFEVSLRDDIIKIVRRVV